AIGETTLKNISFSGGSVGTPPVDVALNALAVQGTVTTANSSYTAPTAATAGTNTFTSGGSQAFDADDALTFDVVVDGGTVQSITIAQADVAAAGNNDNTLDDADELVEILNSKIVGATAAN